MIQLCGNAMPGGLRVEPCPYERGHEGEHVYWVQTAKPEKKRGRNGVWIYDEGGVALIHMTFDGYVTAEEVGAMAAYLQHLAKVRAARDDDAG